MLRRQFALRAIKTLSALAAARALRATEAEPAVFPLEAQDNWTQVGGRSAYLSTFNGANPGPAIEARAGDTLRIQFLNSLREDTNLHFHGLHTPPTGMADNSFLEVPSKETLTYEVPISADHPSGLYWYHPHMHGSVARQVSRGLAGLIFIRGDFDDLPEVRDTPEFPLVLQDFDLDSGGQVIEPSAMERVQGREGPVVTVNGASNPTIAIAAGGWVRLRVLNASVSRFYRLKLEEHPLSIVGTDGGLLGAPVEADELLIVPGQRYEIFVRGRAQQGRYRLLNLPYNRLGGMGGGMGMGRSSSTQTTTLATVEYTSIAERTFTLPRQLTSYAPSEPPVATRTFTFGMGMGMGISGGNFTINGRRFDPARVDTQVSLNSTEDWMIANPTTMDHPFHIHTNAFRVVANDGALEQAWRDVVLVPSGGRVRIRIPFRDFSGKATYHCHILDHEDLGMMGIIEVS